MLKQTAKLVAAYARNNLLRAEDLPELIVAIYNGLATVGTTHEPVEAPIPAVPVKKSVTPDYIVCLEDGKKLKTLKRHLREVYKMTPDEYRAKWGLPMDYPVVAPNYAAHRSSLAKQIGLGRKPVVQAETVEPPTKTRRARLRLGINAEPASEPEATPPTGHPDKPAHNYPASRWASKATA